MCRRIYLIVYDQKDLYALSLYSDELYCDV